MKRRTFLHNLALSPAAIAAGSTAARSNEAPIRNTTPFADAKTVVEPAREVPVIEEPDVLVVGGGPAGVAAALAAARAGAETLLIERYNHLGGLWTGGLVLPLLSTHALDSNGKFQQVIFGVGDEMARRLRSLDMAIHTVNPVVDPEAAKYIFDAMTKEAGVKTLYHCWASNVIVKNNWIQSVILETKSGRAAINPKMVVDCT
ncbi:MAG: FAD-dependent oxidoreductase, partial [Candidatus Omnitrophica bacterium]|nr:FAD-dependent oxidoreductase [Candidatus Omnitrophota bacterium]